MGLLTQEERNQFIDLLGNLPHSKDPGVRNQLISSLPHSLQVQIAYHAAPKPHFTNMVDMVDENSAEPYEGVWPVIQLFKGAIFQATTQSTTGKQLQKLLENIQIRADQREVWSSTFIDLSPQGNQHLEHMIDTSMGLHSPVDWRKRMYYGELATCLIVFKGHSPQAQGTGFLIGPDIIITNYHVIADVIHRRVSPKDVAFIFDYKTLHNTPVALPAEYMLAPNYRLASSPDNILDYALLRVDGVNGVPGFDTVEGHAQRGWLKPMKHNFLIGEPLFIIQHPDGGPLKFAFDRVKRPESSRVYYRTNTGYCSSGAPCFTLAWDLVALHQGFIESAIDLENPNMGIPFSRILEQPDVKAALGM
jgi:hypothetical protein